jgi:serine protease DegQ
LGDVLLAINKKNIDNSAGMLNLISSLPPNKVADLQIIRNGKEIMVPVLIGKRPKPVTRVTESEE